MSDRSNDRPAGPTRPLARPAEQAGQQPQPQPAMSGQYSGAPAAGQSAPGQPTQPASAAGQAPQPASAAGQATQPGPTPPSAQPGSAPGQATQHGPTSPSERSGSAPYAGDHPTEMNAAATPGTANRQGGPSPQQGAPRGASATTPAQVTSRSDSASPRTVRRAKLRVVRLDPWSVTKASFLLSIAFGIMCVVAVFLIFSIMNASGLWDSVNSTIQGVVDQKPKDAFDIKDYVGMNRIMGITMLISAIDVVIITALATLGAFIYNMAASLLGGVEVTLAEDLR